MLRIRAPWQVVRPVNNLWFIQTAFINTNLIAACDIAWNT